MDALTAERYPHGVPWAERPGRHTQHVLDRHTALVRAIRDQEQREQATPWSHSPRIWRTAA